MKSFIFNQIVRWILPLVFLVSISISSLLAQSQPIHGRAIIKPSVVNLHLLQQKQFKVVMLATRLMAARSPEKTIWTVNDVPGGTDEFGTIDSDGVYKAPQKAPVPNEIHIGAQVAEAANSRLYATVIIGDDPPVYKSLKIWSEKSGDSDTHLRSPHGIGLDKNGNILIADQTASRVFRYNSDGKFLGEIGKGPGGANGYFKEPREVKSDADGNICVTDSKGDKPRIQFFNHEGEFLRIFGDKGRGPGQILRSHGIGFDHKQRLFITDVDNMRVNVYSATGEFSHAFSEGFVYENMNPGEFNAPHGISVDPSGDVFVTSYYGPTQKFTPDGHLLMQFAHGDPPDGPVYFHNITGDRWGNVYLLVRSITGSQGVVQREHGKKISIMKFNNNGDYITGWSFTNPEHSETEAAVDENGLVYALFSGVNEKGVEIFIEK
ncbi:MAG: hypothetical protein DWQ05_17910 [Calditrichaeota bacterium]|nr:MAG: hypothetical protein DWQ05_17910 [Calditrichota bacterium]